MPAEGGLDRRLRRIEEIVAALDSDSVDLDEALALFEEGVAHLRRAQQILETAELKVEELIGAQGDEVREFEAPDQGDRDDGDRD
ncbi:MAG: exodeoxyribonuclease VII small subunit [Gemmatimonadota bacterium]|nr:exodeoxyribonuclease VII small subunit [Gemmatimonadota bacterium]